MKMKSNLELRMGLSKKIILSVTCIYTVSFALISIWNAIKPETVINETELRQIQIELAGCYDAIAPIQRQLDYLEKSTNISYLDKYRDECIAKLALCYSAQGEGEKLNELKDSFKPCKIGFLDKCRTLLPISFLRSPFRYRKIWNHDTPEKVPLAFTNYDIGSKELCKKMNKKIIFYKFEPRGKKPFKYDLQVREYESRKKIVLLENLTACSVKLYQTDALSTGEYIWRIRAKNKYGIGEWTEYKVIKNSSDGF